MKNIQFISGTDRTRYPIFAVTEEEFALIFPGDRQNVAFDCEIARKLGARRAGRLFKAARLRKVKKEAVRGIHGTVFRDLSFKKRYFPTRNDTEIRKIEPSRRAR